MPPDFERWHGALERFRVWGLGLDFLGFRVRVFGFKGLFRRLRFKGQGLWPSVLGLGYKVYGLRLVDIT